MLKKNGKGASVVDLHDYSLNLDLSKAGRIAHFLDFRAKSHPKQFVPYAVIAKAIFQLKQMPRTDGKDVETVMRLMGNAKQVLLRDYQRDVVTMRGYGVRASVDSTDALEKVLTVKATRLDGARKSFEATLELIDDKKISPDHYLKQWLSKSVADVSRSLHGLAPKILPPMTPEAENTQPEKE